MNERKQMRGAFDALEPRPRKLVGQCSANGWRHDVVALAVLEYAESPELFVART